jgi:DNA-directed RNA polymerase specialized sigma24 family protein
MHAQAEPPSVLFAETQFDVWPYRDRTVALLKRYARASVEVGRLPSLLGREFFRSRVTSYSMTSFEDMVIFVHDVESALARLDSFHQRLIAMSVLEDYSLPEVARLIRCPLRTVEREVPEALDRLSDMFLKGGLLRELYPSH